jgi:uncharacterized membrane protein
VIHRLRTLAAASYLGLLALLIAWEAWLAPPTPVPRAFWMALKLVPLLLALYPLLRGSARAHVLTALLVLLYFSEGVAVAYTEGRREAWSGVMYGLAEVALAVAFIVSATFYARLSGRALPARGSAGKES